MEALRFRWFVLISLGIHAVILWLYVSTLPFRLRPFSLRASEYAEVDLRVIPSSPEAHISGPQKKAPAPRPSTVPLRGPSRVMRSQPSTKTDTLPSPHVPSTSEIQTSLALGETSLGEGITAPGSEGIAIGSGKSFSGTEGKSSGTGGSAAGGQGDASGSAGTGTGTRAGPPGPKGASRGSASSEKDDFSGIEIPSYVIDAAGFRSSHSDGGIYPEIDSYVLHAIDKRIGIPVPGSEVCIEGDQLHTKERMMITETKIDHSKCRVVESGDRVPLREICPPEAESRTVHFDYFASSPLVYSVRTCLEYDRSHCYIAGAGDEGEREICRVDFRYEGIWAEGTIFDYKCTKSEPRTYRHPLQYEIRWIMEVKIPGTDGDFLAKRQVHQETRTVEQCN